MDSQNEACVCVKNNIFSYNIVISSYNVLCYVVVDVMCMSFFFILLLLLQNMDIACTVYVSTIYQSIWSNWIENTKNANGATDRIKYIECLIGKKKAAITTITM